MSDKTEIQHQLAARYVIGSMRGAARRRFMRLLMTDPAMREHVTFWEQHLFALTETVPARELSPKVWGQIERRLGWVKVEQNRGKWWLWGFTAAAALLLINLLTLVAPFTPVPESIERVAVVQNDDAQTLWLIKQQGQTLTVNVVGNLEKRADADYQLWMLPQSGSAPISLGLLPQQGERVLTIGNQINLNDVAALAVSREPLGGSPLNVPSGPVVYVTDIVIL